MHTTDQHRSRSRRRLRLPWHIPGSDWLTRSLLRNGILISSLSSDPLVSTVMDLIQPGQESRDDYY